MEIKFIGFGGAFDVNCVNSAAFVRHGGRTYLLDCGHSVFRELVQKDIAAEISDILITHLHDDHVGSLSSYLLYRFYNLNVSAPTIWCPTLEFKNEIEAFLSHSIGQGEKVHYQVLPKSFGVSFIDTKDLHVKGMQTFGYIFQEQGQTVVYSGDNGDCDFIFAELERRGITSGTVFHEMSFTPGLYGHTYYKDLEKYQEQFDIYGYHFDPATLPADNQIPAVANCPEFLF